MIHSAVDWLLDPFSRIRFAAFTYSRQPAEWYADPYRLLLPVYAVRRPLPTPTWRVPVACRQLCRPLSTSVSLRLSVRVDTFHFLAVSLRLLSLSTRPCVKPAASPKPRCLSTRVSPPCTCRCRWQPKPCPSSAAVPWKTRRFRCAFLSAMSPLTCPRHRGKAAETSSSRWPARRAR